MLASPELVHPNKYTKLHDVGDILSGVGKKSLKISVKSP